MLHLLNFVPIHSCRASLDSLMHVEDYVPLLQSIGMLLHSIETPQSTMDYSIMAVDEVVVDSPITRVPILERLNSPCLCGLVHFHILLLQIGEAVLLPSVPCMMVWRMLNMLSRSRFGFYLHLQKKDFCLL